MFIIDDFGIYDHDNDDFFDEWAEAAAQKQL